MNVDEIKSLTQAERIAGYLFYSAKLAMLGAKLRKNGRGDETWTKEENDEWDSILDELDPYWYAMSLEEKNIIKSTEYTVEGAIATLTCGESLV